MTEQTPQSVADQSVSATSNVAPTSTATPTAPAHIQTQQQLQQQQQNQAFMQQVRRRGHTLAFFLFFMKGYSFEIVLFNVKLT